jgi:recombination protein RecA
LTLHAIAEAQKQVLHLLMQNMLLIETMLKNLGVDIENLIISQPDNGEQALELPRT